MLWIYANLGIFQLEDGIAVTNVFIIRKKKDSGQL